jgi:hypothetical protein
MPKGLCATIALWKQPVSSDRFIRSEKFDFDIQIFMVSTQAPASEEVDAGLALHAVFAQLIKMQNYHISLTFSSFLLFQALLLTLETAVLTLDVP